MASKLGIRRRYLLPRKCFNGCTIAKYRSIVTDTVTTAYVVIGAFYPTTTAATIATHQQSRPLFYFFASILILEIYKF